MSGSAIASSLIAPQPHSTKTDTLRDTESDIAFIPKPIMLEHDDNEHEYPVSSDTQGNPTAAMAGRLLIKGGKMTFSALSLLGRGCLFLAKSVTNRSTTPAAEFLTDADNLEQFRSILAKKTKTEDGGWAQTMLGLTEEMRKSIQSDKSLGTEAAKDKESTA